MALNNKLVIKSLQNRWRLLFRTRHTNRGPSHIPRLSQLKMTAVAFLINVMLIPVKLTLLLINGLKFFIQKLIIQPIRKISRKKGKKIDYNRAKFISEIKILIKEKKIPPSALKYYETQFRKLERIYTSKM